MLRFQAFMITGLRGKGFEIKVWGAGFGVLAGVRHEGRFYVLIQIAEFTIGKSIIDFHTIRIRANHEQNALFQL